tara:strand:+ start:702 stop:1013 length:312 start_codon:yes stop_codon:yes gene_type:complete
MKLVKGDLVLIKTLDDKTTTCIIAHKITDDQFYYCYSLESGDYKFVYIKEIESLVCQGFAPDIKLDRDLFNVDYSYYDLSSYIFPYIPTFDYLFDDDIDEDDS